MFSKNLLYVVPLLFLLGCATFTQGSGQRVGVSSDPAGADVYIDNVYVGRTPLRTTLVRSEDHTVRIELPGYRPYVSRFTRTASGMVLGNALIGGPLGVAVDVASGAIYRLTPSEIHACLTMEGAVISQAEIEACEDCFVFITDKPDANWERVDSLQPISSNQ